MSWGHFCLPVQCVVGRDSTLFPVTQSLQRWGGQLRCPCLLAPWTLLRHLCPSVSLPWFLFLSLLATIGAAYPGIRLFCIPYRIVWTYQHPLCFLISILYLFLFLSQCRGQPFSLAVWEECCELTGLGLSFIQNREDSVWLPSPAVYGVWRWTCLGVALPLPLPLLWISQRFLECSGIRYLFFPDGSTWLREDFTYLSTVRSVF